MITLLSPSSFFIVHFPSHMHIIYELLAKDPYSLPPLAYCPLPPIACHTLLTGSSCLFSPPANACCTFSAACHCLLPTAFHCLLPVACCLQPTPFLFSCCFPIPVIHCLQLPVAHFPLLSVVCCTLPAVFYYLSPTAQCLTLSVAHCPLPSIVCCPLPAVFYYLSPTAQCLPLAVTYCLHFSFPVAYCLSLPAARPRLSTAMGSIDLLGSRRKLADGHCLHGLCSPPGHEVRFPM